MNTYIVFYKGKRYAVQSDTSYHAQQLFAKLHKITKRQYEITVVLAEKDGQPVSHVADF